MEDAKWYVVHTYSGYENAVKSRSPCSAARPPSSWSWTRWRPWSDPCRTRSGKSGRNRRPGGSAKGVPIFRDVTTF